MDTIKFEKRKTKVIAHRGLSSFEQENTNSAFVAAGNRSYYGIETDIYKTADGGFIASHDKSLHRVSGENISVEESTLIGLQSIVLYDKDGSKNRQDLRPASLQNYINICKKYNKHCILEIKSELTDEDTQNLIDIIKDLEYLDKVTFISFSYDNLIKIRKIVPSQSVQYLFSKVTNEIVTKVVKDKFDVDVNYKALNEKNIKKFHDAKIRINCWTVDKKKTAEKLALLGVDYITTNILE